MGFSVRLSVGPNSKIVRIGERAIRLDHGRVSADARHGTDFRILTKRLAVRDRGMRFWVGTTPNLDTVTVEDGAVAVEYGRRGYSLEEGQVLIAQAGREAQVVAFPAAKPEEPRPDDPGSPLNQEFAPSGDDNLDMYNGRLALVKMLSGHRSRAGSVGGSSSDGDYRYRCTISICHGLRGRLRVHFREIAQAMAGRRVAGEWEIPLACLLVDGIQASPPLPADVYYVRLIAANGAVSWRLTGALGHEADFPLRYDDQLGLGNGGPDRFWWVNRLFQQGRKAHHRTSARLAREAQAGAGSGAFGNADFGDFASGSASA